MLRLSLTMNNHVELMIILLIWLSESLSINNNTLKKAIYFQVFFQFLAFQGFQGVAGKNNSTGQYVPDGSSYIPHSPQVKKVK